MTRQTFAAVRFCRRVWRNKTEDDVDVLRNVHSLRHSSRLTPSVRSSSRSPSQYLLFSLSIEIFLCVSVSPALTRESDCTPPLVCAGASGTFCSCASIFFHMFALSLNNYRMWADASVSHFDSFIMTQWEVNKLIPQMMNLERRSEEKPTEDMSGHRLSRSLLSSDKYLILRLKFMG